MWDEAEGVKVTKYDNLQESNQDVFNVTKYKVQQKS